MKTTQTREGLQEAAAKSAHSCPGARAPAVPRDALRPHPHPTAPHPHISAQPALSTLPPPDPSPDLVFELTVFFLAGPHTQKAPGQTRPSLYYLWPPALPLGLHLLSPPKSQTTASCLLPTRSPALPPCPCPPTQGSHSTALSVPGPGTGQPPGSPPPVHPPWARGFTGKDQPPGVALPGPAAGYLHRPSSDQGTERSTQAGARLRAGFELAFSQKGKWAGSGG